MARDAEEGIGAFIEKRDPEWEDRDGRRALVLGNLGYEPWRTRFRQSVQGELALELLKRRHGGPPICPPHGP